MPVGSPSEGPDGTTHDPLIGKTLGGCRIIRRVGAGGMAVVYEAEQRRLQRIVALKVLHPQYLAGGAEAVSSLRREARLAAGLEHPNIISIYDVGEDAGRPFIVMPLIDGETVHHLIRRQGPLSTRPALEVLVQACRGLEAAHEHGLVHRDIKPSNLLMDRHGVVRISDFGLAKSVIAPSGLSVSGRLFGTVQYMSPEQARGEPADIRSDIYSLGVSMYEMLTGRVPFSGNAASVLYQHEHAPLPAWPRMEQRVPASVIRLVERMLAKRPADRFQSPQDLIAAIGRIGAAGAEGIEEPAPPEYRESFLVAQAVLEVAAERVPGLEDANAVWQAFIDWRGSSEADYLTRMRAGGRHVFYAVLQDLYAFAEEVCHADVTEAVGEHLSAALLEEHIPDLLQTVLTRSDQLARQIAWLIERFVAATTGELYRAEVSMLEGEDGLNLTVRYRSEAEAVEYLRRSGHNPERAFGRSLGVFFGAVRVLLLRTIHGFEPEQFRREARPLWGRFTIALKPENRFHYENMIDILTDYVHRLRERTVPAAPVGSEDPRLHSSPAMRPVWDRLQRAAASDETVLLCGESGTGKSHYARVMHDLSGRRAGPFVEVGLTADVGSDNLIQSNLFGHTRGAFTGADEEKQGLFALAAGGTIFLDEVGDASPELQAKLLRVIERKCFKMLGGVRDISVDLRIIAATNQDLAELVRQGRFREDLYYRLNVIHVLLPPLRSRAADVPELIECLFDRVCQEAQAAGRRLTDETVAALRAYPWPGNIRELENALRHALAFAAGPDIGPDTLPEAVRNAAGSLTRGEATTTMGNVVDRTRLLNALSAPPPPADTPSFQWPAHVDHARRQYLLALIQHYQGNLKAMTHHWNRSSENTLLKLIREFGLEDDLHAARNARP